MRMMRLITVVLLAFIARAFKWFSFFQSPHGGLPLQDLLKDELSSKIKHFKRVGGILELAVLGFPV